MASVAVATPTLPVPRQHFVLFSLLATPIAYQIISFGWPWPFTNIGNDPLPLIAHVIYDHFIHKCAPVADITNL